MSNGLEQKKYEELLEILDKYEKGMSTLNETLNEFHQLYIGYDEGAFLSRFRITWVIQAVVIAFHNGKVVRISWTSKMETLDPTT